MSSFYHFEVLSLLSDGRSFKSVGMYSTFDKNKIKAFDVPGINQ